MPVTVLVAPGPEVTRATPTWKRPGIAVRSVDRSLFVTYQDMPDVGGPGQFVIDIEDHPPG